MKVGFNMLLWTPFVTEQHFYLFDRLKAAGYDGVELEILQGDSAHYRKIARTLRDVGLESTAVTVMPDPEHSPISPDPRHRQAALDHLAWAMDCTASLGAHLLCGPLYQPLGVFSGQGPTEEEKSRAAEVHRRAAEIAVQHDITLAIEPLNRFEAYFLNTLADAAALVRRVDHPNFGAMYDTFHANIEEKDPVGCLSAYLDIVRHVHISENDRGTPGRGHIPWAETFRALRRGGYDGWLTVEAFGRTLPELAATTCVWRDLSANDEEVYTAGYRLIRSHWKE